MHSSAAKVTRDTITAARALFSKQAVWAVAMVRIRTRFSVECVLYNVFCIECVDYSTSLLLVDAYTHTCTHTNYSHTCMCRERELFIGTQCSNLYTSVDTPAKGRVGDIQCMCADMCTRIHAYIYKYIHNMNTYINTPFHKPILLTKN